jgi:hypothetical protein
VKKLLGLWLLAASVLTALMYVRGKEKEEAYKRQLQIARDAQ